MLAQKKCSRRRTNKRADLSAHQFSRHDHGIGIGNKICKSQLPQMLIGEPGADGSYRCQFLSRIDRRDRYSGTCLYIEICFVTSKRSYPLEQRIPCRGTVHGEKTEVRVVLRHCIRVTPERDCDGIHYAVSFHDLLHKIGSESCNFTVNCSGM